MVLFGIGGFELFLILIFGFLIFGPDKLPAIAKTIGKAIAKFRDAQEEMSGQLKKESFIDKESDEPFKNPLDVLESTAKDVKKGVKDAKAKADAVTDSVLNTSDDASSTGIAGDAGNSDQAQDSQDVERVASFAERKAKYDRERKARREAEAKAASEEEAQRLADEKKAKEAKENPKAEVSQKKIMEASDDADVDSAGEEN